MPESRIGMDMHVIALTAQSRDGAFHYHSSSENVYYVLSGSVRVRLTDGDVILTTGDAAWISPGLPHGVSVQGGEPVGLLEIYWPAPADYVVVQER